MLDCYVHGFTLVDEREHDSRDYLSLTQHANDLAVFLPLLHKCAQGHLAFSVCIYHADMRTGEVLFNFDSHISTVAKQAHLAALSICMLPIRESLVRLPTAEVSDRLVCNHALHHTHW